MVFDSIQYPATLFEQRIEHARNIIKDVSVARMVDYIKCESRLHAMDALIDVISNGGEGLMLRRCESVHKGGRSNDMKRLKPMYYGLGRVTELSESDLTLVLQR